MADYSLREVFKQFGKKIFGSCVNSCVSESQNLPLAASQGKVLQDQITQLNSNIEIKHCFCKNIASVDGIFEGYGYNYCYYNKSAKIGILHFASRIETPDSTLNNFSGYYDVTTVLENMGITSFNKILESNYTPYDSTGVVRAKLIGYGTTLLYSSASQHYAFARYYTKDGEKGAWATSEFQKGYYITGSLIFS